MSREEAMNALIESGMELRRDDIELGKKLEQERIIKMLETRNRNKTHSEGRYCGLCEAIYLIKGEQK